MNNKLVPILMTASMMLLTFNLMASPPPGTGGPIDGGVTALVIGSAYYGYKKLKANKKEKGE